MRRAAGGHLLRQRLANRCRMLEAMARTGRHEGDALAARVGIDDEAGALDARVQARFGPQAARPEIGQERRDIAAIDAVDFGGRIDRAIDVVRIGDAAAFLVADFYPQAGIAVQGKAVKAAMDVAALRHLPDEHGQFSGMNRSGLLLISNQCST